MQPAKNLPNTFGLQHQAETGRMMVALNLSLTLLIKQAKAHSYVSLDKRVAEYQTVMNLYVYLDKHVAEYHCRGTIFLLAVASG